MAEHFSIMGFSSTSFPATTVIIGTIKWVNISFYKISFNHYILSWNSLWCPDILAMELLTMDPGALQNLLRYLTLPRGLMTLLGWIPFYIPGRSPLHYDEEVDKDEILKLMMNIWQDKAVISFTFYNYLFGKLIGLIRY